MQIKGIHSVFTHHLQPAWCPDHLRIRRYFKKKTKDGAIVASKEAMAMWQTDDGRDWGLELGRSI